MSAPAFPCWPPWSCCSPWRKARKINRAPLRHPPGHRACANRDLRLANLGYLGHMWELYSMWGWITLLLAASAPTVSHSLLETVSFLAIAVGAIGCVWAGYVSDRGRQRAPVETPNLGAPPNAVFVRGGNEYARAPASPSLPWRSAAPAACWPPSSFTTSGC